MIDEALQKRKFDKYVKLATHSSLLAHTGYYFQEVHHAPFIVNDHHVTIADALDDVMSGKIKKLMLNVAPRYTKTELAVKNFISKGLAVNPASNYIHLSYSDDLALGNSEGVKTIVQSPAYQRINPGTRIRKGSTAKKKWTTTRGGGLYATSTGGQVTGFGAGTLNADLVIEGKSARKDEEEFEKALEELFLSCGINRKFGGALIIDDPIKPEDALSDAKRERVNNRYDSTIKNRVNSRDTPIIIIMQRVHENDLCGHLLENEPGEWTVISLDCIVDEGLPTERALWPFKHTLEELRTMEDANPHVFNTQYRQDPRPIGSLLYQRPFRTYPGVPFLAHSEVIGIRKAYIDTADEGKDYLCAISYLESRTAMYVLDVIYTQKPMEFTEPETAKMLADNDVTHAKVESNNGGRGFARNVERELRLAGNTKTTVLWFHQTENKIVRINTNSNSVQNLIYFPENWDKLWPKFYKHVTSYLAIGINAHDDAPDVLSGMVENYGKHNRQNIKKLSKLIPRK